MARMLFLCIVHASILKCLSMAISTSGPMAPGTSVQQSMTHAETSTINRNKKKKTTVMDVSLVKYLRKFKYLDPSPCPSCDQDSSIISEALSTLQQWAHINNTGILDSDTVEVMSKRRCGVPDEPKQFSVSSVKNKRHKRGFFWQIYHGSRWYKNDLTYIINMPHKFPNKRAVEKIISAALHAWESVTQLTFTQKRYGYADIEVNFLTGRHGDGSPFDGNGGILAHAFFPYDNSPGLSGDAHFDADEDWGSEMDLNTTADLYCVAVHEFGHSLGLMHSRWPISIMWPWMKGDCTLSKFDVAVIQKIYGPASERKWKRQRPTARPPQTTRPFIKPNRPTITTTKTSTPSPPTASASTAPVETVTMSPTPTASILTSNNINTIANTAQVAKGNTVTVITTDSKSPSAGSISMTVTQTDRSNPFPVTTGFLNLFQPSITMANFVSTPKEDFQIQETATPKSLPVQNSQKSPSRISFINNLPSKTSLSTLSSLVFQTLSIPDNISDEQKSSHVPILGKNGFLPQIQPSDLQGFSDKSYSTENGLLLKSSPSEPNTSVSESTQSSLNVLHFINTFSTPNILSSLSQPSQRNDLSSEPSDFDSNNLASVSILYTQNGLSQNLSSQPKDSLLKHSQSEPTRPPLVNNFSLKKTLTSDSHSLPSASRFYMHENHLKRPHFLNEINQIKMFSHLPQIPTSSSNPRLPLQTSGDPLHLADTSLHDYQYLQMFDSSERNRIKEKVSRPMLAADTEQLIPAITSVTSQPKSSAANFKGTSQFSDIQNFLKIQDQHSPDELVFGMHPLPERNSSFLSTQLYKTATISMTTKPVVSSNELKWMLTPASQVTIDSEPTIPIQTSPEFRISLHLQQIIYNDSALWTESNFDPLPSTKMILFDKANNGESLEKNFLIPTEQENGEVLRLKLKLDKTDRNNGKTIQRTKELYEGFYQEKTIPKLPNILKERSKLKQQILPIFHKNSYDKLRSTTSKYNKIHKKLPPTQTLTLDKKKRPSSNLRFPLISSEAVPGFGKALRQQNQEREVFLPSSLQKSVGNTFLKSPTHPTSGVPFVDPNMSSLSSSTTLFAGGADAKKNRLFQVVGGKKRVKMFKPRFRQKMRMQQFIQNLLYSTMRMIPRQGPPKLNLLTTPSPHQNAEVSMRTLSSPPTNHVLSHVVTPSFKAETYLIPEALSHKFLSAQTSPTTQKWTGDTQRNIPQILNFQAQDSPRNDLHDPLRVLSIDQQTTPLLLMMQNPLEQKQPLYKGQGHNDRNSNLQASSLLPYRLKAAISDQENVQTTSETIFRKIVTPHHQQQMAPMSIYMKKLKESQEGTVSSSRIHKRSLGESTPNHETTSENWMSKYSPIVTTSPSFVSQSTLHSHQVDIVNSSSGGDNSIRNISERYSQYSERNGIKTPTMPTPKPKTFMLRKPWCSGSVEIDGATVDGNETINIFKDSNVMRFPFCARNNGKKRRTFIPISKVFPNGPNNITAAATIVLGKKRKWERTYLFQGQLVWRYRKCLRRYCLDRGYPTNTSQEFNISTPIEITAAYMHNRRRTLFLFNGTSLYHTVRCLRWLRKSGCSSTETEMQPGLLSSLRSIDAMFTHQGNFYVVHGGSYFTKMLRSMKNNIFQHGSIAESWYGCQRKTF